MYQISIALSIFYLLIVNTLAIVAVHTPDALKTTAPYLSALHGLVGAAVGAFFGSTKADK